MTPLPDVVLTGPPVVGKGTVSKVLLSCSARTVIDTGARVRQELADLGEPSPERNRQGEYATEMIRKHGGGYFADRLLASEPGPHIVDGPRRQIEIEHLLRQGAVLVFMDAPLERRHAWSNARGLPRDRLTLDEFQAKDKLEWGYVLDPDGGYRRHTDPYERNLRYAHGHAHIVIHNSHDQAALEAVVRTFVEELRAAQVGPGSHWAQKVYGRPSKPIMLA